MKYYTPELEEFFPGFEYEEYSQGYQYDVKVLTKEPEVQLQILSEPELVTDWVKRVYELQNFVTIIDGELSEYIPEIRVKYLDEQDIKDLGWQQDENYPTQYYLKDSDFTWTLVDFEDFINIETSSRHVNFNVTIKNKSELKRLMKQLGI